MNPRLYRIREAFVGMFPWDYISELWEVRSSDLREQEFEGSYEDCLKYLQASCPIGGNCE